MAHRKGIRKKQAAIDVGCHIRVGEVTSVLFSLPARWDQFLQKCSLKVIEFQLIRSFTAHAKVFSKQSPTYFRFRNP